MYGRHFLVIDDAYQRGSLHDSQIAAVIAHVFDFQILAMLLSLRFASCKITKICNQLWSLYPKSVKEAITANLL